MRLVAQASNRNTPKWENFQSTMLGDRPEFTKISRSALKSDRLAGKMMERKPSRLRIATRGRKHIDVSGSPDLRCDNWLLPPSSDKVAAAARG